MVSFLCLIILFVFRGDIVEKSKDKSSVSGSGLNNIFNIESSRLNSIGGYISIIENHNATLAPYSIILFQLLKYIFESNNDESLKNFKDSDKDNFPGKNEKIYSNMVRSLLNNNLLLAIAVRCVPTGKEGILKQVDFGEYRYLLERYSMFEHLIINEKYIFDYLYNNYKDKAWDKNIYISGFRASLK